MSLSLVIATYNSQKSLEKTLEENLKCQWDEIVIVDGFSTDRTKELVTTLSDSYKSRIVFHQTPKKGLANARNIGTRIATGEYVMHAGPDNIIPVNVIQTMLQALQHHDLVSCMTRLVDIHSYWDKAHDLYKKRLGAGEQSVVGTPYLANRSLFLEFPFDEAMLNSDDTELCARLTSHGKKIYRCPDQCEEYGFSTVADFKERWMRWGRGDALFYNKMKSSWTFRRRAKSLLRPFMAELVESKRAISWPQYIYCFPFLVMVFAFRYYGWFRYEIKTKFGQDIV